MKSRTRLLIGGLLGMALAGPTLAASSFETFVGYADNLRPSPFFPTGLCTGNFWNGASGASTTCAGQSMDSGAIMFVNNGTTALTISGLTETNHPGLGGVVYNVWGTLNFTLAPGQDAVFTQTGSYNFDSSDNAFISGNSPTNNCSVGALSSTSLCLTNAPVVSLIVDGSTVNLSDSAHVLDTGGYDSVSSNPCIGGNNVAGGNTPGACNESLQWRLIGTTGVENPGGGTGVPEPATLALLGLGLAGLGFRRHRRS